MAKINIVTIKIKNTLKELFEEKNLSLRELAKRSGVPYSTLQEWSSNRSPKNPVQTQKVAQVLGVSLHYLLFGQEDGSEPLTKILKEDISSTDHKRTGYGQSLDELYAPQRLLKLCPWRTDKVTETFIVMRMIY